MRGRCVSTGESRCAGVRAVGRVAACLLVAGLTSGCGATHRPGFVLSLPAPSEQSFDRVLWIEPVELREPQIEFPEIQSVAFTYNLARYLRQRELFRRVRIRPGRVDPEDWIATLEITRMDERERSAVRRALTRLVSAVTGGTGALDVDYEATLEVRDAEGERVGTASLVRQKDLGFGRRNVADAFSFFLDERRRFIDQLFARALGVEPTDELEGQNVRPRSTDDDLFEDDDELSPDEEIFDEDGESSDAPIEPREMRSFRSGVSGAHGEPTL